MEFTVMRFLADGAVLQCGENNPIYGTAEAGSEVEVRLDSACKLTAAADEKGKWQTVLPPVKGGFEEHTLKISCGGEEKVFSGLLFGELYHISGQSNMELPMSRTYAPFGDNEHFETPYVREFRVPVQSCFDPTVELDDFENGCWLRAEGESLMQMSAAGYWFAYSLYKKLDLPIGLMNTAAGGAMIEGSFSYEMLREIGGYEELLDRVTVKNYIEDTAAADNGAMQAWYKKLNAADSLSEKVLDNGFKLKNRIALPAVFKDVEELKGFCGRLWFKKRFVIEDESDITDGELILGTLIDNDKTYVNGEYVGQVDYLYPPRIYKVSAGLLKKGENVISLCLEVKGGCGAFVLGKNYCLRLGEKVIDLKGEWEYEIAAKAEPLPGAVFFQGLPMALYGKMVHPAFRVNVKGLLYYQGESNAGAADKYPRLFKAFAEMYRKNCKKDLPIIFTQLPNFTDPARCRADDPTKPLSGETSWAMMRQKQTKCLEIPNTAMAVILDSGEFNDLHPTNKRTVGERLAMAARGLIYGEKGLENTFCVKAEYLGESLAMYFKGPDLEIRGGSVKYLQLCYEGGEVKDVNADLIDGKTLMIPMDWQKKPLCVRYAWLNCPEEPSLYNKAGLPVTTFSITVE